jgi:crotonobetainyl-CoA:carnitine CoA-transferase CaiB-like acyl-CoA transferase
MTDGMVGFLPAALFFRQLTGQEPKRADGLLSHRYACYNTYETADGRYLSIGAVENRFWKQLCDTLDVPEYARLQYDDQRRQEILQYMRKTFKQKNLDEWNALLADQDICWGKIQPTKEVLEDPLFLERETVVEIENKDGQKSKTLGVTVKLSETPGSIRTAPVDFGESTAAILEEMGYTPEEIKNLEESEVI